MKRKISIFNPVYGYFKISPSDFPVTCTTGYRFGFNGMEKDDEVKGLGNSLDFGERIYDSRLGRWLSIDPLASKYPSMSPYVFVANDPINLIDPHGLEPIDPRTGKPISLNLSRAAVYDANYINYAKLSVVKDNDLYKNASPWFARQRDKPDGAYDGGTYFLHESNFKYTSAGAISALSKLFPSNGDPGNDWGSPNDEMWRDAADLGTYTFLDDRYSESEIFQINQTSFNIMTVEQNYITQIVNLTRPDGDGSFNINSVTSFEIQKGDIQTRQVETRWGGTRTEKYRTLSVTETTQGYKNNQPSGAATSKTYTSEENVK